MQIPITKRKRMASLKLLRIHDITRVLSQDMQVYPGDPKPKFEPQATIQNNGVNVTRITVGTHTGTHVDAPRHFLQEGTSIEKESLEKFIGEAVIIDISHRKYICSSDLSGLDIKRNDIVLINTGTGTSLTDFVYIDESAAKWMVEHRIETVGIDTASVEKYGLKDAPVHKLLLGSNIGIIENLTNLKEFAGMRMFLVCMPLPLRGVDGSPARAILCNIVK